MMTTNDSAKLVVLRPAQEQVFDFHRCAARVRARGRIVREGDMLIAYRVDSTVPEGPVMVTDNTEFVFAS